ncbi:MAG TPA: universal stress protein [Acidimicrobiales bacterium]|nr:universal stress protein [Acidimicrobiales bacterium]
MFERIVVGVTRERTAKEAVGLALQVAAVFDAELHVVTAFDDKHDAAAADRAAAMLDSLEMSSGRPMEVHSQPGDPATVICDVAREVGADLIVVGNKGLAASSRWSKSVPGEITRTAPCSVLVLDTV